MRQEIIRRRLTVQLSLIGNRRRAHHQRLVHLVQSGTGFRRHALTITCIRPRARGPLDRAREVFRHHLRVPLEPATGQHDAFACRNGDSLASFLDFQPRNRAVLHQQLLRRRFQPDIDTIVETAFQKADRKGVALGLHVHELAPHQLRQIACDPFLRVCEEEGIDHLLVAEAQIEGRRTNLVAPVAEDADADRRGRDVAPERQAAWRLRIGVRVPVRDEAQRRLRFEEFQHFRHGIDERRPERFLRIMPAVRRHGPDILQHGLAAVRHAHLRRMVMPRRPDAAARHRRRPARDFALLGHQHRRPERAGLQSRTQPRRPRADDNDVVSMFSTQSSSRSASKISFMKSRDFQAGSGGV